MPETHFGVVPEQGEVPLEPQTQLELALPRLEVIRREKFTII